MKEEINKYVLGISHQVLEYRKIYSSMDRDLKIMVGYYLFNSEFKNYPDLFFISGSDTSQMYSFEPKIGIKALQESLNISWDTKTIKVKCWKEGDIPKISLPLFKEGVFKKVQYIHIMMENSLNLIKNLQNVDTQPNEDNIKIFLATYKNPQDILVMMTALSPRSNNLILQALPKKYFDSLIFSEVEEKLYEKTKSKVHNVEGQIRIYLLSSFANLWKIIKSQGPTLLKNKELLDLKQKLSQNLPVKDIVPLKTNKI